jgi:hypothetical protein
MTPCAPSNLCQQAYTPTAQKRERLWGTGTVAMMTLLGWVGGGGGGGRANSNDSNRKLGIPDFLLFPWSITHSLKYGQVL